MSSTIMKIIKRNGKLEEFNGSKIRGAIRKASTEIGTIIPTRELMKIDNRVREENELQYELAGNWLSVENVQDIIETELMGIGFPKVAKAYILYRQKHNEDREKEWEMTDLQRDVLFKKYIHKDETFNEFIKRVGGGNDKLEKAIRNKEFLFAGRILDAKGSKNKKTYSSCFVVEPPEDNLENIFDISKKMAVIFSMAGGVGTDLSKLRPRGAKTHNSARESTGAVSFAGFYSDVTGLISQKGRRGATMLTMSIDHPDIEEFIKVKSDLSKVTKANISIRVTHEFMNAVIDDEDFTTSFTVEHNNGEIEEITKKYKARKLFRMIAEQAHDMAEPGLLFWDTINEWYLLSEDEDYHYDSTNPCFTGDTQILTKYGYREIGSLSGQKVELINNEGEVSEGSVWSNGVKDIVKINFYSDKTSIKCTPDHVFMLTDGTECESANLQGKRIMPFITINTETNEFTKYGFLQGDGNLGRLSSNTHKGLEINLSKNDEEIRKMFHIDKSGNSIYINGFNEILINLGFSSNQLPYRELPTTIDEWNNKDLKMFIKGLYSANGSVITNHRVALKTTNKPLAEKMIELLKKIGIEAYYTINKSKKQEFYNGVYTMKESYDVNISQYSSIEIFAKEIGFVQKYKRDSLADLLITKSPVVSSVEYSGTEEVFDFNEPINHWGVIEGCIAHNCAEKPLPANSNCLLGSINLSSLVRDAFEDDCYFDTKRFKELIELGITELDNAVDEGMEKLPFEANREFSKNYRPIGLGYFGYGDMLIKMGITYGSDEAIEFTEHLGYTMITTALDTSIELAKTKGSFKKFKLDKVLESPFFQTHADGLMIENLKKYGLRNAELLSIAPTGSLSLLAGTSSGIEPIYKISYTRKTETISDDGDAYYKIFSPVAKEYMKKFGITEEEDLPDYFIEAEAVNSNDRLRTQATWQRYIDASISSTINLPESATIEEVENIYMNAWELGLKGTTVFRDGCKRAGILGNHNNGKDKKVKDMSILDLQTELSVKLSNKYEENPDVCPKCGGELKHTNGCEECVNCGWSPCSI